MASKKDALKHRYHGYAPGEPGAGLAVVKPAVLRVDDLATEIEREHTIVLGNLNNALRSALRIGELLIKAKAEIGHGKFTAWITENLPFTERTARNYMRIVNHKEEIAAAGVTELSAVYQMIADNRNTSDEPRTDSKGLTAAALLRKYRAKERLTSKERVELKTHLAQRVKRLQSQAAELNAILGRL
jgi:Protein of unknown function (DUF3102)